jgi:tetrahydromethanopterin S-methyltransferase subunit G
MLMSEYTHNDDVADLLYAKDQEIDILMKRVKDLKRRLEYLHTEIDRLEKEHANGL